MDVLVTDSSLKFYTYIGNQQLNISPDLLKLFEVQLN